MAGIFLTGGGALAGFHLGHRAIDDLDLFTTDDRAFERGRFVLEDVASHRRSYAHSSRT